MKGVTHGSFLAVLKDGTHLTYVGVFSSHDQWHEYVRHRLQHDRYNLTFFVYAWGSEHQAYTPAEVREVFFGDANRA